MNKCKNTIPKDLSLHDNRCWSGYCIHCNKQVYFCEYFDKYICCDCCKNESDILNILLNGGK
jgi:hypothetical protein